MLLERSSMDIHALHRQRITISETAAAWNTFLADFLARDLSGVRLVTSDAHRGLVDAIAPNLPGIASQRCRTHYAANLMSTCPKAAWPAVEAGLPAVYDQPDAASVNDQFDRFPEVASERQGRRPRRRRARGRPRGHRVLHGDLTTDLVEQPQRATQLRDQPPHGCRLDLCPPRRGYPPGRRGPGRADRRMARRTPIRRPRRPTPLPTPPHHHPGGHHHRPTHTRPDLLNYRIRRTRPLHLYPGHDL